MYTTVTGSGLLDGTDSNIYVTVYGTSGTITEMLLDNPAVNDFKIGAYVQFHILV